MEGTRSETHKKGVIIGIGRTLETMEKDEGGGVHSKEKGE